MKINQLKDGDNFSGPVLVTDCKKCVKTNGDNYLNILLQDNSGQIDGKLWSVGPNDEKTFSKGNFVLITGKVLNYNKSLQIKITSSSPLKESDVNVSDFVLPSPVKEEILTRKLSTYVSSIEDNDLRKLVSTLVNKYIDKFKVWPAAMKNHHEFVSGLIYHSITMADLGLEICHCYPKLNRDFVLAGCIVHDFGKLFELSSISNPNFTLEGKLLGHVSMGFYEVRNTAKELGMYEFDSLSEEERTTANPLYHKKEVAVLLEHIVLSHHGKLEFGSPVLPLTREALAVSFIDDFDAKMMMLDKAYASTAPGESTAKLFAMDDRYFYNPASITHNDGVAGLSLEEEIEDLKK